MSPERTVEKKTNEKATEQTFVYASSIIELRGLSIASDWPHPLCSKEKLLVSKESPEIGLPCGGFAMTSTAKSVYLMTRQRNRLYDVALSYPNLELSEICFFFKLKNEYVVRVVFCRLP
jgi:hypothetical protein